MNQIQRKKGLIIFILVEVFWFVSFVIHEAVHSLSFFVLSRRFGEIHILDSVSASYNTIAVSFSPSGLVVTNHIPFEIASYMTQIGLTIFFAVLLYKKYYCYPSSVIIKKSEILIDTLNS